MNPRRLTARPSAVLLMAIGLLIVGWLIEAALITPRLKELDRLTQQRGQILQRQAVSFQQERQEARCARLLGAETLEAARAAYPRGDPLSLIAEAIARSRLERVEIITRDSRPAGPLQSTDLVVRVRGPFARILGLVQDLERGPALARISSIVINPHPESQELDAVVGMSIYTLAAES